jgi:hypothetical protein
MAALAAVLAALQKDHQADARPVNDGVLDDVSDAD